MTSESTSIPRTPSPIPGGHPAAPIVLRRSEVAYAVCRLDVRDPVPNWVDWASAVAATGDPVREEVQRVRAHAAPPTSGAEAVPTRSASRSEEDPRGTLAAAEPPSQAREDELVCVCRTAGEFSIVAAEHRVPLDVRAERGFILLSVAGPIDFAVVGLLATLTSALAAAAIPVFVLSTFDTDHLLIRAAMLDRALHALRAAGCIVEPDGNDTGPASPKRQ